MSNPTITDRHRKCAEEVEYLSEWGNPDRDIIRKEMAELIAKHFPAPSPTKEPLYRIKPLVFDAHKEGYYSALSPLDKGVYRITNDAYGWSIVFPNQASLVISSLEDGKAKCEEHYRAFIAAALEVVEP